MRDPLSGRGNDSSRERTALVTGITGQDGACLAQLLLAKGYRVTGTTRSLASANFWRLEELGIKGHASLEIVELDVADSMRCLETVRAANAAEIYNLGGLSFIGDSFADPLNTARVTGLGAWNLLEAVRTVRPETRFFQASSSEMFGVPAYSPQDEDTAFNPRSPYAAAKVIAHWATVSYRETFGVFAASGILYNHESPLRDIRFVTRKITSAVARIKIGAQEGVELGNLDAQRDWGYAPEFAEAMWLILQAEIPDSYVLATNTLTSVRSFVGAAFKAAGIEIRWQGQGLAETGVDTRTGKVRVRVSAEFFRAAETSLLRGNPRKSGRVLGWKAATPVEEICRLMVTSDLRRLERGN